ncbi:MAG: OmpH family outer membrane protein [Hasllibacter sp.]
MRRLALALALAASAAAAQDEAEPPALSPGGTVVLVLDRDRVLAQSRAGAALLAEIDAEGRALASENAAIQEELRAEEADLTARREGMDPAAFREEASAFDERVQAIRAEQDGKTRALLQRREAIPDLFWEQALPALAAILDERGAGILLERGDVFLSSDTLDITDEAIARIDAATEAESEGGDE